MQKRQKGSREVLAWSQPSASAQALSVMLGTSMRGMTRMDLVALNP